MFLFENLPSSRDLEYGRNFEANFGSQSEVQYQYEYKLTITGHQIIDLFKFNKLH